MSIGGRTSIHVAFFDKEDNRGIGGMETHASYFIRYFSAHGYLRYIVHLKPMEVVSCENDEHSDVKNVEEIVVFLRKKEINVLFFNDGQWIEHYKLLREGLPEANMIMRSGGNEFVKAPLENMWPALEVRQKKWAEIINNNLNFMIANSAYSIHRMMSLGIRKDKIILVRGGVDLGKCNLNIVERNHRRELFDHKYGTEGKALFGIVSRFERFKGILEVLSMLAKHQDMDWHIIIAGEGSEGREIYTYLSEHFMRDKYSFIGKVDHDTALSLISILDYLINCSLEQIRESGSGFYIHTETMGRSMIEAICQRTPVIATSVGGTAELFHENGAIGIMVKDISDFEEQLDTLMCANGRTNGAEYAFRYDWGYIFKHIYVPMMLLQEKKRFKTALVLDMEGTIIHEFLTEEQNQENLYTFLKMCNRCCIIINTAGDYEEMLANYPVIKRYLKDICVIANCGKKLFLYGQECHFWENYGDSLFGPSDYLMESIKTYIEKNNLKIIKTRFIDKLYVNLKVDAVLERLIGEINDKLLKETNFSVCKNKNNIKVISDEINKGNTLRFIANHILKPENVVGAGNNILDIDFLKQCTTAYLVNCEEPSWMSGKRIMIDNQQKMEGFIKIIENDIT